MSRMTTDAGSDSTSDRAMQLFFPTGVPRPGSVDLAVARRIVGEAKEDMKKKQQALSQRRKRRGRNSPLRFRLTF